MEAKIIEKKQTLFIIFTLVLTFVMAFKAEGQGTDSRFLKSVRGKLSASQDGMVRYYLFTTHENEKFLIEPYLGQQVDALFSTKPNQSLPMILSGFAKSPASGLKTRSLRIGEGIVFTAEDKPSVMVSFGKVIDPQEDGTFALQVIDSDFFKAEGLEVEDMVFRDPRAEFKFRRHDDFFVTASLASSPLNEARAIQVAKDIPKLGQEVSLRGEVIYREPDDRKSESSRAFMGPAAQASGYFGSGPNSPEDTPYHFRIELGWLSSQPEQEFYWPTEIPLVLSKMSAQDRKTLDSHVHFRASPGPITLRAKFQLSENEPYADQPYLLVLGVSKSRGGGGGGGKGKNRPVLDDTSADQRIIESPAPRPWPGDTTHQVNFCRLILGEP